MRRSALVTVAVLGGLVCLLGGTVLFSALQDTARTGTNSVESAALGSSADIQLATATRNGGTVSCGTFSENLTSGLFTATGVTPHYNSRVDFCIKNVGSQPVTLSALADELTDVDVACTGDEAANGDATCGGDQLGELSSVLLVSYMTEECSTAEGPVSPKTTLKNNETTPHALGTLGAGAYFCYAVFLEYSPTATAAATQAAQSDRVTWRFKFTAQA
jgi:hypothetical protein